MKVVEIDGIKLNVMAEYTDEKYGRVWRVYLENGEKTYILEGKIIEDQQVIDELDNKYGKPVSARGIII